MSFKNSVLKELAPSSRDLTNLVKTVKDILPQFSEDMICEALVQTDEEVPRAVDLLLNTAISAKARKKKEKQQEEQHCDGPKEEGAKGLAPSSRDLTGLVNQVKGILPHFSDDMACEALVQTDEDVEKAIELLLSSGMVEKAPRKKKGKPQEEAAASSTATATSCPAAGSQHAPTPSKNDVESWADANTTPEVEAEYRPKTPAEREAAKWKKKLREIERIEEKLKANEKVDPLQLPKLDKKTDVLHELAQAEKQIVEDQRQREAEERRIEAERRQKEEEERRLAEEARRREAEQRRHQEESARQMAAQMEQERQELLAQQKREQQEAVRGYQNYEDGYTNKRWDSGNYWQNTRDYGKGGRSGGDRGYDREAQKGSGRGGYSNYRTHEGRESDRGERADRGGRGAGGKAWGGRGDRAGRGQPQERDRPGALPPTSMATARLNW